LKRGNGFVRKMVLAVALMVAAKLVLELAGVSVRAVDISTRAGMIADSRTRALGQAAFNLLK
jgi:hypothetical protein